VPFVARNREGAFPDDWDHLAGALAARVWHRHHLSAGSSQVLAIALLASATRADPLLGRLSDARCLQRPLTLFEVELAPSVLRERPRQTSLDWLVLDRHNVIAAEAKFTERGLGQCSCEGREAGLCSERVLERPYWCVASKDMRLASPDPRDRPGRETRAPPRERRQLPWRLLAVDALPCSEDERADDGRRQATSID
jgi:hypothetical protein